MRRTRPCQFAAVKPVSRQHGKYGGKVFIDKSRLPAVGHQYTHTQRVPERSHLEKDLLPAEEQQEKPAQGEVAACEKKRRLCGRKDFRLVTRSGKTKRDRTAVNEMMKRKESEIDLLKKSLKQIRHGVTPDIMLSCTNCGYEIRVGKKLAA